MSVVREDVVKMGFDIDFSELDKLSDSLDEVKNAVTGGIGDDAFDEMISESKKASEGVDGIKESLDGVKPGGLDETVKGLKDTDEKAGEAHEELKKVGNTGFDKTISGLKSVTKVLGKVAVAAGKVLAKGIAAGAAGVGALVSKSVMNYADYEQLVGGVDTLFKDSSGAVQKNAQDAFKTAGLSANDYMETVTSFSASLIQSLGGDTTKAADYAHTAIVDMSDNANKMGTDIGSIQDAYQGFAKQNYTMLDNLKLGYGGTQEEMKRLLKDAEKISGQKFDLSSYADIVQAIHVIQENMDIAGTTSKEASETISGSWSSMKAAWSNTLTSLVLGGDDFDRCVDNLVDSAKTFGKNIMPAIEKALEGVGDLITELAPIIEKELPGLIDTLLPPLIKAATSLLKGVIIALPDIISTIIDEIPDVLSQLWGGLKEAFGNMPGMGKAEEIFGKIKTFFEKSSGTLKKIVPAVLGVVAAIKIFNKLKGLSGLFGGLGGAGGGGGGLFGMFGNLAKLKPQTVLKGMLNLGIIIGGLSLLAAALMAAAPHIAKLSDMKSFAKLMAAISVVGLVGSAMAKLAGYVGNIPVAAVAKGLANIAIVLVGFGALAAVLMWLAPYIMQLGDLKTTMKLLVVIGAVGLIGSALAGLAGLIGIIPIPAVLAGLANIALALGGFTAIVEAFGLLTTIPGFNEFLTKGGEVLTEICGIIGEMAGSIIGGIGEGITNSLPAIGENISAFAESIAPAMEKFSGMNFDGISSFASAFGTLVLALTGEKIASWFTGGIDYAKIGTDLTALTTNGAGFFEAVQNIPEAAFTAATNLFQCLNGIGLLPNSGGVVQWFTGEVDYAGIASGLNTLAGTTGFFTAIQAIPEAAFTAATNLFNCLSGIGSLPNSGGVKQWFTGEVNYQSIADGIAILGGESMIAALTAITAIPAEAYSSLTALFDALAGVKQMPSEGGIFGWFTGDKSTGLTNVASQLPGVAENIASFFTNLGGRTDFTPIKTLFDTLSSVKIDSDAADKGFLGLGSSEMEKMGSGLSSFATNAKGFFDAINDFDVDKMKSFFAELATVGSLPDALSSLDTTIGTELSNMVTTVETKMGEIKTATETGMTDAIAVLDDSVSSFVSSGVNMMRGVNDGMNSMRGTLIATAQSMASAIQKAFNVKLKINSPSREGYKSGAFYGEGIDLGMQSKIPNVKATSADLGIAAMHYVGNYTPESTVTNYNGGDSEYTNVAPVFNLTISGTQDDRSLARKVKRYVSEAISDTFESLERKNPVLREA